MIERLVDVTAEREAPEWVLSRLRDIDPYAEIVYVGLGKWWVGVVKPNSERMVEGRERLARAHDRGEELAPGVKLRWVLQSQGFGLCATWHVRDGEPDWGLVIKDFEARTWAYNNWGAGNEVIQRQLAASGLIDDEMRMRARAATVERLRADERYIFNRILRGNPSPVPGANLT